MAEEVVHEVVKLEEQSGNLPPYIWYGQCSCGFATRMATEALVQSQLNAHLANHGVVASVLHSAPEPVVNTATGKSTGTWTPLGAKKEPEAEKGPLGGFVPLGSKGK